MRSRLLFPRCRCLRRNDYNRGPYEARSCAVGKGGSMKRSASKFALSTSWSLAPAVRFLSLFPPEEPTPEITVQADSNDPSQEFVRPQHENSPRGTASPTERKRRIKPCRSGYPAGSPKPKACSLSEALRRSGTKVRDPIGRFQITSFAAISPSRARARYASARLLSSSLRGHHSSAFGIIGRCGSWGCRSREPTQLIPNPSLSSLGSPRFCGPPSRSRPFSTGGWIAPAPRKSFSASARTRPDSRRCDAGGTATVNAPSSDGDVCLG